MHNVEPYSKIMSQRTNRHIMYVDCSVVWHAACAVVIAEDPRLSSTTHVDGDVDALVTLRCLVRVNSPHVQSCHDIHYCPFINYM